MEVLCSLKSIKGQCFGSVLISCAGTEPFAFMALTGFPLVSLGYKNRRETSQGDVENG